MVRTLDFKSYSNVISSSYRHSGARASANFDVRVHIGESRDSGFARSPAPRNDLCALNFALAHISRHAEPECVLDDTQADLAAERHQRFRMELNAADRQRLVLDRHCDAVLGTRRDRKHVRHAVALDIERMITADHDFIGQVLHQSPAADLDPRWPSMRRLTELAE